MGSKRLTQTLRENIKDIVINQTFEQRQIELKNESRKLFHVVVNFLLPYRFKQILEKTEVNPDWFLTIRQVYIKSNTSIVARLEGISKAPVNLSGYCEWNKRLTTQITQLSDDITRLVLDFSKKEEKILKDKKELISKLHEVLYSVNTYKQLKELWPEVENYYKLNEETKNLPTVIKAEEINKIIKSYRG